MPNWMKAEWFQRLGGGWLERLAIGFVSRCELAFLAGHKEPATVKLIRQVRRERVSLLLASEAFILHSVSSSVGRLPGDFAEVGVYQGASARILCEIKGDRQLHLFDTFEGLPAATAPDRKVHRPNAYACNAEPVRR